MKTTRVWAAAVVRLFAWPCWAIGMGGNKTARAIHCIANLIEG